MSKGFQSKVVVPAISPAPALAGPVTRSVSHSPVKRHSPLRVGACLYIASVGCGVQALPVSGRFLPVNGKSAGKIGYMFVYRLLAGQMLYKAL